MDRFKKNKAGASGKPAKAKHPSSEMRLSPTQIILGGKPLVPKNGAKSSKQPAPHQETNKQQSPKRNGGAGGQQKKKKEAEAVEAAPKTNEEGKGPQADGVNTAVHIEISHEDTPPAAIPVRNGAEIAVSNTNSWTMSHDVLIMNMKAENASWAEIAGAVDREAAEVKKRYHELKAAQANAEAATEDAANHQEEQGKDGGENEQRDDGGQTTDGNGECGRQEGTETQQEDTPDTEVESQTTEGVDVGADQDEEPAATASSNPSEDVAVTSEGTYAGPDTEPESEAKSTSESEEDETDDQEEETYEASSSSSSSSSSPDDYDPQTLTPTNPKAWARERRRQQRFAQRHLWASLGLSHNHTNPSRRRQPQTESDALASQGFSRSDRRILAALQDRAAANRYLEMQANFFNATGRMVPLYLLKARLESRQPDGPEDRHLLPHVASYQQRVSAWNAGVAAGQELLDPSEASDVPVDALCDDDFARGA